MPLVVPGINSQATNKTDEWQNKLVGKTVKEDDHSEVASAPTPVLSPLRYFILALNKPGYTNFCKRDLPEKHRVIEPGTMVTKDFHEDRLNVFVNEEGMVTHCTHG
ncbi:peptidase inhibitor i78 family domain-containing protein [Zalerion maritima]|uniref:Peptidase inhibitor i78 family domain-containing protein n=1 Tax=Zalerion maritima TaxID=339359 RepID=A0AAD5S0R0_9PEZI|nr:peptidase inhibitor i78 family domain-containing protein [Zalerion maritima]